MFLVLAVPSVGAEQLCRIQVVEQGSGWPVPLVELRTTHQVRFVSDNAGIIAFDLSEMMGQEVWFSVEGHGYEVPADGMGYRGVRLTPRAGEALTVAVQRRLPAKRLGRITGSGIFGESQRFGLEQQWQESGIVGCDSVQTAVHQDRLYWFWQDTSLARYPLGLFHMIGATTPLRPLENFRPPIRLRYDYVTDSAGVPREVGRMPGNGPTWISGTISLPDKTGRQRLVGTYAKIEPPLVAYEFGLCVWDDEHQSFQQQLVLWTKSTDTSEHPPHPAGHPVRHTDRDGQRWVLFGDPFPQLRCAATFEAWSDPESWQRLEPQRSVRIRGSEEAISPHRGSIAWNAFRQKWVAVFTEHFGKGSPLGEIWYTESKDPLGPWEPAVKVVTHNNYTFYNPCLHPEMTPAESPILLFEGTYTKQFSGNPEATPRHDYNQVLYRLDLDDHALVE